MKRRYKIWLADFWYASKEQQTVQVFWQSRYLPIESARREAHPLFKSLWNWQIANSTPRALWVPPHASAKHHVQTPSCAGFGGASRKSIRWRRQLCWPSCAVSSIFYPLLSWNSCAAHTHTLAQFRRWLVCQGTAGKRSQHSVPNWTSSRITSTDTS